MNPNITMYPVDSSNINSLGYDHTINTAYVKFKDNPAFYMYEGVTPEEMLEWSKAPSLGSHFHHSIKGKHKGCKV